MKTTDKLELIEQKIIAALQAAEKKPAELFEFGTSGWSRQRWPSWLDWSATATRFP